VFSDPLWNKLAGNLFTGQAASGIKAAWTDYRAVVWNVGTCRSDAKGDPQAEILQEAEYQCGAQGRIGS